MSEDKKGIVKGAEKQSTNPGEGPPVEIIFGRNDLRANIDKQVISRQAQTPTIAVHAVDKTYNVKPLSTPSGLIQEKKKEE